VIERAQVDEFARDAPAHHVARCRCTGDLRGHDRQHGAEPLPTGDDQVRCDLGEVRIGGDDRVVHRGFDAASVGFAGRERQQRRRLRAGRDVLEGHVLRLGRDRATDITQRRPHTAAPLRDVGGDGTAHAADGDDVRRPRFGVSDRSDGSRRVLGALRDSSIGARPFIRTSTTLTGPSAEPTLPRPAGNVGAVSEQGTEPTDTDHEESTGTDHQESPGEIDVAGIEADLDGVQAALGRLADGTYWTDEVTGEPIPTDVLAVDPLARRA